MADIRFFETNPPLSLGTITELTKGELSEPAASERLITGVGSLETATDSEISYLVSKKYRDKLQESSAAACFVLPDFDRDAAPAGMILIFTPNPQKAFAQTASALVRKREGFEGVSANASIADTAKIGDNVRIGPGAVIFEGVEIGADSVIGPNSVIGQGVQLGRRSRIGANVSVECALIGNDVWIDNSTSIGQAGFGYASDAGGHTRIPQLGRVVIQDRVEIGANCTIDRGADADTIIGEGTIIDNLVHIAHNCRIGRNCIFVTMVGISGSCTIGDGVVLAGKVGVSDHITIGDGAMVAARAAVLSDLAGGQKYGGFPAKPLNNWRREIVLLNRLVEERRGSKK